MCATHCEDTVCVFLDRDVYRTKCAKRRVRAIAQVIVLTSADLVDRWSCIELRSIFAVATLVPLNRIAQYVLGP